MKYLWENCFEITTSTSIEAFQKPMNGVEMCGDTISSDHNKYS